MGRQRRQPWPLDGQRPRGGALPWVTPSPGAARYRPGHPWCVGRPPRAQARPPMGTPVYRPTPQALALADGSHQPGGGRRRPVRARKFEKSLPALPQERDRRARDEAGPREAATAGAVQVKSIHSPLASPPTDRQVAILAYIARCTWTRGWAPSLRELGKEFDIRSTNGVSEHLRALVRHGLLERQELIARA